MQDRRAENGEASLAPRGAVIKGSRKKAGMVGEDAGNFLCMMRRKFPASSPTKGGGEPLHLSVSGVLASLASAYP